MANQNNTNHFAFKYGISNVITSFVYYASMLRDTLEYCVIKPEYSMEAYKVRKHVLTNEIKIESPLHQFLKNNKEKGEKLLERLEEFAEDVYGDESTILSISDDKLIVDYNQSLTIIEGGLALYEEIMGIIKGHIEFAKKNNMFEQDLYNLVLADDEFFRSVSMFTLNNALEKQFLEFNKLLRESNGTKTAASNFVEQDLSKLFGLFNLGKRNALTTNQRYQNNLAKLEKAIFYMTGKEKMPEGSNFKDVFEGNRKDFSNYIGQTQILWAPLFNRSVQSLVDSINANKPNNNANN